MVARSITFCGLLPQVVLMIAAFEWLQHRLTDENNTEDSGFDFTEENYKIVKTILAKYPKNYKQASCVLLVSRHFSAAFAAPNAKAVLSRHVAATPPSTRRRLVPHRGTAAGMRTVASHLPDRWTAHALLRRHGSQDPPAALSCVHFDGTHRCPVRWSATLLNGRRAGMCAFGYAVRT